MSKSVFNLISNNKMFGNRYCLYLCILMTASGAKMSNSKKTQLIELYKKVSGLKLIACFVAENSKTRLLTHVVAKE